VKGDEGVAGWGVSSTFPNVKAGLGWPNPDPDGPNVSPEDDLGFSSNLPPKGLESPVVDPKLNDELVFSLPWPKLSTRPAKNESSLGREVVTSTALVGLSSILTSSSSLGGVTGRGKLPNSGLCVSAVLGLVVNVNPPELDVGCEGPPNCGEAGFSGELEVTPNLKANGNADFVSFGPLPCTTMGVLVDSPGGGVGVDCSTVNGFGFSVDPVAPNPVNGVPDERLKVNIDVIGSFCSELVVGVGPIVGVVEGPVIVETFVGSTAGLWDGKPPNELDGG